MYRFTLRRTVGAMAVALLSVLLGLLNAGPARAAEGDAYDPQHTMLALNMAVVSMHRILATQDRIVLNQEYDNIINNLSLGNIRPDSEIMELYKRLMDAVTQKRLNQDAAKQLQNRYDQRVQRQFSHALSKVQLQHSGGGHLSLLFDVLFACVSSYFTYQDVGAEFREELDDALWKLRATDIEGFNNMQKQLLESSWRLLAHYRLPDEYRLVQRALDDFHQAVNESDANRRLRMLRALEGEFRVYPSYWFYRARAARDAGEADEARKCLDTFDEVWRPVLRRDPFKLEASKARVYDLLVGGDRLSDDIRQEALAHLEVMRDHTPRDDWANNLFAGMVYFALGEKQKGIECVELNVIFNAESKVSTPILTQMRADKLDPAALSKELQPLVQTVALEKALIRLRGNFLRLYAEDWASRGMAEKLEQSIMNAFNEQLSDYSWWVRWAVLRDNKEDIIERIEDAATVDFSSAHTGFLIALRERFGTALQLEIAKFYPKTNLSILPNEQNPMTQANIASNSLVREGKEEVTERVNIKKGIPTFPSLAIWCLMSVLIAVMIILILAAVVMIKEGLVTLIIWCLLFGGACAPFFFLASISSNTRQAFIEENAALYSTELPQRYWEAMEPYVCAAFIAAGDGETTPRQ